MVMSEVIANSPTPGIVSPLTTLTSAITSTSATVIATNNAVGAVLQAGQFRILVDQELMLVTGGQSGTSWTVQRGVESSGAMTHSAGVNVYHVWTAQGVLGAVLTVAAPMVSSGLLTLVGGTKAVANTAITVGSILRLTRQATGGTLGQLSIALSAGTGFTVNSSSGSDTSTIYYEVVSY